MIDIGANLTHDSFSTDLEQVLERARSAGLSHMVVTGCDVDNSRAGLDLSRRYPGLLSCTAGVHPHAATTWSDRSLGELELLAAAPEVVSLGECGLDFHRDFSPRPQQEKVFEAQLELAVSVGKPVFLHQREAHDRFIDILGRYRDRLSVAVAHCFTGTREELLACLGMDLHVGITGWICDERRGHHLREFIHEIPDDRLMIETDAPYLLPRDLSPRPRDRRNEPMYLPHVAATVALARNQQLAEVIENTTLTSRRFFGLPA